MKKILFLACVLCFILGAQAQNVTITPSGITPKNGYPRLSYDAILQLPNPTEGDSVYDITFKCLRIYNGSKWQCSYQNPTNFTPNIAGIASGGGSNNDFGKDIAVDDNGNVYVTGHYSENATFGDTSITSAGSTDIFIAKYNSIGTLQWIRSVGGKSDDQGYSVATDKSGNVYVTGYFTTTAFFGNITKTSMGFTDIFVAKYNSNGILQWVQAAGGNSGDEGYGIATDGIGNVYVTGSYFNKITFGDTSITSAGSTDIFIAKYNSSGTLQWIKSEGGSSGDLGRNIALDGNGYIYIIGDFYGTALFGSISKTSAGNNDVFIAKFNNNGLLLWVHTGGGVSYENGQDVAVDSNGDVLVTGGYAGIAFFDGEGINPYGSSNYDMYVAKYSRDGNLRWIHTAGGSHGDSGNGIAIDKNDNVYVIGNFSSIAKFDNVSKIATGGIDIFIAKYNSNGILQWVQAPVGDSLDIGYSIVVAKNGSVYGTGYFGGTATFGNTEKTSIGSLDIIVMRLDN